MAFDGYLVNRCGIRDLYPYIYPKSIIVHHSSHGYDSNNIERKHIPQRTTAITVCVLFLSQPGYPVAFKHRGSSGYFIIIIHSASAALPQPGLRRYIQSPRAFLGLQSRTSLRSQPCLQSPFGFISHLIASSALTFSNLHSFPLSLPSFPEHTC